MPYLEVRETVSSSAIAWRRRRPVQRLTSYDVREEPGAISVGVGSLEVSSRNHHVYARLTQLKKGTSLETMPETDERGAFILGSGEDGALIINRRRRTVLIRVIENNPIGAELRLPVKSLAVAGEAKEPVPKRELVSTR